MYQTVLKQIKNADTPANLKIAMKKKEKMDAKYPALQGMFGENEQIVKLDDARF